ncbi:unnamed protein product [Effrenium voratum]|nr:unnamed protein product [Effrenium voratum]
MDNHRVRSLVSLAGPQMGVYGTTWLKSAQPFLQNQLPMPTLPSFIPGPLVSAGATVLSSRFYSFAYGSLQHATSLANLWHDPLHQEEYLKGNVFLPRANGEVESSDTERHRRNFIRLGRAVFLVGSFERSFDSKLGLQPWQTGVFGFYREGSDSEILPMEKQKLFVEDTFGLRSLKEAGKLHLETVKGVVHEDWASYAAVPQLLKGARPKFRASLLPLIASWLLPWAFFALIYISLASSAHLTNPWQTYAALAVGAVLVLCFFFAWLDLVAKAPPNAEPSMLGFFAFAFLLAFVAGLGLGSVSYDAYTFKWFEMTRLNIYRGVDPDVSRGTQLMDAGFIDFLPGTHLQTNISMGYKDDQLYCVAPLQLGVWPPVTYDFWLVGKDCCQASRPGFSCGSTRHEHPKGLAARRLMNQADSAFYKLAVRQAEAAYGIQAAAPLFLEPSSLDPTESPAALVDSAQKAMKKYLIGYLIFQFVLVLLAIFLYFSPTRRGERRSYSWLHGLDGQMLSMAGDFNALCGFGLANAWYDYGLGTDSANVSPRSEVEVAVDEDEDLIRTVTFPRRLDIDPFGASATRGHRKEPAVSRFLTDFCRMVWPELSGTMKKLMDERVQEALHAAIQKLPESMRGEVHHKISFGDSAPSIEEVYSWRQHPCVKDGIELCGKMRWDAPVDMQLTLGPLKFGINRIKLEGVGCIIFRPLMDQAPILGGFHLFYCSPPELRVGLVGLGGITRWAAVDNTVSELMAEAFKMVMVLPQRMTQRFANTKIDDMPDFRCPPPIGVLRLQVQAARGLPAADFYGRSDPYIAVKLGNTAARTSVRPKTLDPDWTGEEAMEFVVYHERQDVCLEVYHDNIFTQDKRLACLGYYTVADLVHRCEKPRWLDLKDRGAIQLRANFVDLCPCVSWTPGSRAYVLVLKIFHLRGVPPAEPLGTLLRLRMGEVEILSRPCKALDPGNVGGFGKRISAQILQLRQRGVGSDVIAEVFGLTQETVEEVHRVQANTRSWFGWDEAHHELLPKEDLQVVLEVRTSGRWPGWQPLAEEKLQTLLLRCRSEPEGRVQLPFDHGGGKALVGLTLELLHG